ncbi:DUF2381 family protein [Corallococcus llansteffanensis]|uniref:DUF2381 family protein n=1 Tax=Corallococcus llansteffanensis TaxID=2316731 RepID=UPI001315A70D|nr:DUF2381 family protein [Corallococcus llansteffanensis]
MLASAVAGAQPRPAAHERQVINTQRLVLHGSTTGPALRVRVAPGLLTTIVFDAALVRDSVTLDGEGTRVRRVDVGDTSVTVEPLVELGNEPALLRVHFVDGAAPEGASLALVSDVAQVDSHVRVSRRAQPTEALEKELAEVRARCEAREAELAELRARCETDGLVGLVLAGSLGMADLKNVNWFKTSSQAEGVSGLKLAVGNWMKATPKWMLLAVSLENLAGQPPWSPDKVTLRSMKTKEAVQVRVARMNPARLGAGEEGLVVMEAEPPSAAAGARFLLELSETASGRRLSISLERPSSQAVKP